MTIHAFVTGLTAENHFSFLNVTRAAGAERVHRAYETALCSHDFVSWYYKYCSSQFVAKSFPLKSWRNTTSTFHSRRWRITIEHTKYVYYSTSCDNNTVKIPVWNILFSGWSGFPKWFVRLNERNTDSCTIGEIFIIIKLASKLSSWYGKNYYGTHGVYGNLKVEKKNSNRRIFRSKKRRCAIIKSPCI